VILLRVVSFAAEAADLITARVRGTKLPASLALVYVYPVEPGSGDTLFSKDEQVAGAEIIGKQALRVFEGEVDGSEFLVLEVLGDPSWLLDHGEAVVQGVLLEFGRNSFDRYDLVHVVFGPAGDVVNRDLRALYVSGHGDGFQGVSQ
jgi:hypothetical protein